MPGKKKAKCGRGSGGDSVPTGGSDSAAMKERLRKKEGVLMPCALLSLSAPVVNMAVLCSYRLEKFLLLP